MKKAMILLLIIVLTLSYKVKASTYSTFYKGSMTYKDLGGSTTSDMTLSNDGLFSRIVTFDSNNLTKTWWAYYPSNQTLNNNSKSIIFNVKLRMNSVNSYDISMSESQYTCNITGTYHEYSFPSGNPDIEFEYNSLKCNGHSSTGYADLNEHKFSIIIYYIYNNNDNLYVPCNAIGQAGDTYTFSCPITTNNINGFRIAMSTNMPSTMIVGFPALYTIENDSTQTIIDNQNNNTDRIQNELNQTQEYTEDMNTNMTGVNETIEYSTQEQNLKSQLDLNTSMLDDLYIDSSTSGFIWDLVGGLRNMNPAIITLMSTMLGLGVIRLILNR